MESQSRRLLQFGISLFLIAIVLGFFIQRFAIPRVALSAHLIGIMQGLFLVAVGLLWQRLKLTPRQSMLLFWLLAYEAIAAFSSNVLAAAWGAGGSIIPMATAGAHGSTAQEVVLNLGFRPAGVALILSLALILWGLRRAPVA